MQPEVVDIQTAQGATLMSTTHLCLKTCYVRDRLGEIRPIVVNTYFVPVLKYDLLSVKGLNKCGYAVSLVYKLLSTKGPTKSNLFHLCVTVRTQVFFYLKLGQISAKHFEMQYLRLS